MAIKDAIIVRNDNGTNTSIAIDTSATTNNTALTISPTGLAVAGALSVITSATTNVSTLESTASGDVASIGLKASGGTSVYLVNRAGAFTVQTLSGGYTDKLILDTSGTLDVNVRAKNVPFTDNDLSFDMSARNNFVCTPTAGGTLTFTNITSGQSGFVLLTNNSNYAIAAAAATKVEANTLARISTTGTYLLSYFSNGTNVYVSASGAMA